MAAVYIDSCIPMYLVGKDHPHKCRTMEVLPQLIHAGDTLVTSAEVFQEIIHRYRALSDLDHLHRAYEALEAMAAQTYDIEKSDVDAARTLVTRFTKLSSRDCLHAAVMKRHQCQRIFTFDTGYDGLDGVVRIA